MKLHERNQVIHLEQELDDVDAIIAGLSEAELAELAAADAAIELATMLYKARENKHLTQADAAQMAGLQQQAVSRMERPGVNPRLTSVRSYLSALGYSLELRAIDKTTGKAIASATLP